MAERLCQRQQPTDTELVASYTAPLAEVRAWADRVAFEAGDGWFVGQAGDQQVAVCWFDFQLAKPPPIPNFDRFVLLVHPDGGAQFVLRGYRNELQPEPPIP